jgi:hypothetical protein
MLSSLQKRKVVTERSDVSIEDQSIGKRNLINIFGLLNIYSIFTILAEKCDFV